MRCSFSITLVGANDQDAETARNALDHVLKEVLVTTTPANDQNLADVRQTRTQRAEVIARTLKHGFTLDWNGDGWKSCDSWTDILCIRLAPKS
jgi:hypothetical protein